MSAPAASDAVWPDGFSGVVDRRADKSARMTDVKVVAVGDYGVGKSSLLMRFAYGTAAVRTEIGGPEDYTPYVMDNTIVLFQLPGGGAVSLGLWDTGGAEDYWRLRPLSYPQTSIFLLFFSVEDRESFDHVVADCPTVCPGDGLGWRDELQQTPRFVKAFGSRSEAILMGGESCEKWLPPLLAMYRGVPVGLVGLKSDLRAQGKATVSLEEAQQRAQEIGAAFYAECSATTGEGVEQLFERAGREAIAHQTGAATRTKGKKCTLL